MHRLIIWSYVKEKILEKPIIGNGFFSSRNIANENLITERGTNYQLIPLHPHNSILQIWLELGIIGLFLFFLFIKFLITKIFKFAQFNHKVSTVAIISFFLIFFIGLASFGLWQSWWISIIAINIILYNFIFIRLRHIC